MFGSLTLLLSEKNARNKKSTHMRIYTFIHFVVDATAHYHAMHSICILRTTRLAMCMFNIQEMQHKIECIIFAMKTIKTM